MAHQSPDRREILEMLARVSVISQVPGFRKWLFASDDAYSHSQLAVSRSAPYQPRFCTPAEYKTLDVLCELIIPADDTPGAHEAGVAEFIDFMVSHDEDLQYSFRTGLTWLDTMAKQAHGLAFIELPNSDQAAILRTVAGHDTVSPERQPGRQFFLLARRYTVLGFYTSRIGLESLNYPGLRLYSSSPECPHKDDPEHKHLSGSR